MNDVSSGPKEAAPDPEIPDALRSSLGAKKRPAGFAPKSPEAEDDNVQEQAPPPVKLRNLSDFWKKLAVALKSGTFYRQVIEEKDVKRRVPGSKAWEWVREKRTVKVPVEFTVGADGLPYTAEPVDAEETRRIKALSYPGAPAMDRLLGDLTPEFSEWLYLTHPYDAAVRYAGRSTHVQIAALDRVA